MIETVCAGPPSDLFWSRGSLILLSFFSEYLLSKDEILQESIEHDILREKDIRSQQFELVDTLR